MDKRTIGDILYYKKYSDKDLGMTKYGFINKIYSLSCELSLKVSRLVYFTVDIDDSPIFKTVLDISKYLTFIKTLTEDNITYRVERYFKIIIEDIFELKNNKYECIENINLLDKIFSYKIEVYDMLNELISYYDELIKYYQLCFIYFDLDSDIL